MVTREPEPDDRFVDLLVAYEAQLAAGATPLEDCGESLLGVSDEMRQRLDDAKDCLRQLDRVWPHVRSLDVDVPTRIGRFQILREVGRGGFGIVYLANDPSLGRSIALKVQRPEAVLSPILRDRFIREAKAAGRLRHPNIAVVHDANQEGLRFWIASEYCEGHALAEWLDSNRGGASPRTIATFMATLAAALEYAHQQSVLHRDLKPSNVLLQRVNTHESTSRSSAEDLSAFTPKVIDFGLARLDDSNHQETRSGAVLGTPAYMAPEQAVSDSQKIGPATDVYGLGTILYELLTGRAAFGGENDLQTLRQIVENEPQRPLKLRGGVPADLEAICLKCLEKQPHKRYPTAAALAADLERFLAGRPTEARPASLAERLLKWAGRRPALAALLGVSVAAVVLIVAMTIAYVGRLREANEAANASRLAAEDSARKSQEQEQIANQYAYAAQMRLAYQSLDQGQVEQAQEILKRYQPGNPLAQLRGFEWYHLKRRLHSERLSLAGHKGEVYAVTFSPDGRQTVTGGQDGTIRFWETESGQELKTIAAHKSCVNVVVYSPNGTVLASASCDHTIKLWDAATLQLLDSLDGAMGEVHCLAFCPTDGNWLACGGHNPYVRIWDLATREIVRIHDAGDNVNGLAWQPDGRILHIAGGGLKTASGTTSDWDIASDDVKPRPWLAFSVAASSTGHVCFGATNAVVHAGPSPDSQPMVLAGHEGHVDSVVFAPRGDRFASASPDRMIRVWDTERNVCTQVFTGHTGRVQSLAFSPDGATLGSTSYDGTVKLWNADPMDRTVRKFDFCVGGERGRCLAISPDFRYLALFNQPEMVRVYRLGDGSLVGTLHNSTIPRGLQFVPGRPILFGVAVNSVQGIDEWDVENWVPIETHRVPPGARTALVWSSYLVAEQEMMTTFTDESTGTQRKIPSRSQSPSDLIFSPDASSLAIFGADLIDPFYIFKTPGQHVPWEFNPVMAPKQMGNLRAISNGAHLMAGQLDRYALAVVESKSGRKLLTLRHPDGVGVAAFSPDGKTLATSCGDQTVFLWNVTTGQELARLATQPGTFLRLQFSADGRRLAVVSQADIRLHQFEYTYPDGVSVGSTEYSTAVITIFSGIEGD